MSEHDKRKPIRWPKGMYGCPVAMVEESRLLSVEQERDEALLYKPERDLFMEGERAAEAELERWLAERGERMSVP